MYLTTAAFIAVNLRAAFTGEICWTDRPYQVCSDYLNAFDFVVHRIFPFSLLPPSRARPERKDRLHYSDAPMTADMRENGVSGDSLSSLVLVRELPLWKGFAHR